MPEPLATETPVVPAPPPVEPEPAPAPLNLDDEAAIQAVLEEGAITPPDGEALLPSGNVGKVAHAYREQVKSLKAEIAALKPSNERAQQLEQHVADLSAKLEQATPYVQAYQQAQAQPPQPAGPQLEPVSDADAEAWAKRLDLYKSDGSGQYDLVRAADLVRSNRAMIREEAQRIAQHIVAPYADRTIQGDSTTMLARAKATAMPNGSKPSAEMLDLVWSRIDPALTATIEGAKQAYMVALGYTQAMQTGQPVPQPGDGQPARGPDGKFISQPAAPVAPVPRETPGGQEPTSAMPLSDQERQFMQQSGFSEAEYLKRAGTAPWLK